MAGGDVELSRDGAWVPESERIDGGGVGRSDGPKKSALREWGTVCWTRGVSSVLTSDLPSEPVRRCGLGGGEGAEASSEKGEAKKAYVLLAVGEGGGEDEAVEGTDSVLK